MLSRPLRLAIAVVATLHLILALCTPSPTDLGVYRDAALGLLEGKNLYDESWGIGLPFTYPPVAALLFIPCVLLPMPVVMLVWTVLGVAAIARIAQLVSVSLHLPRLAPVLVVVLGLAEPSISTVLFGQVNLFLAWLVVEDVLGRGARSRWGGVLTGVAAGIKLTPAVFWLPRLLGGDRRGALLAPLAGLGTLAASALVLPGMSWQYWTQVVWDPTRPGPAHYALNQSAAGWLARTLGRDSGGEVGGLVSLGVTLAILAITLPLLARLWRREERLGAILVAAGLSALVSPISWSHHLVLIPLLGLWLVITRASAGARVTGAALMAWTLAAPYQWAPQGQGRELSHGLLEWLVTNALPLLLIAGISAAWGSPRRGRLVYRDAHGNDRALLRRGHGLGPARPYAAAGHPRRLDSGPDVPARRDHDRVQHRPGGRAPAAAGIPRRREPVPAHRGP